MEEKTEAVKSEETTVGLTMNYNPFSFISCQEDALVLAGCISHGLDADVIKKSGDLFATARAMLLDACVCLLYRQGGDSMSMQGLVDLLQNDISHNEDQDIPSIKAAYDKIEADGATVEEDLGLKRYRMFQAIAYGETAISVELDLYAKLSAIPHGVSHCADLLVGALLGAGGQLDSHHCTVRDEHHRPQRSCPHFR